MKKSRFTEAQIVVFSKSMKNKRRVVIRLTLTLIISHLLLVSCNWNRQNLKEVESIAFELSRIDSIKDFSSNKNYPVAKVENIGFELYTKLRCLNKGELKKVDINAVQTENHLIQRFGTGITYEVVNHYENDISQRYFLFYSDKDKIYRIIGF